MSRPKSRSLIAVMTAAGLALATTALAEAPPRTPSPSAAKAYIISPSDGATVSGPVTVLFGLKGMGIAPAGVDAPNTGHHHLMIDRAELPAMDVPLGTDGIRHFGGGQTEVTLELEPGEHTLQLLLGDKTHTPHDPPVLSEKITITVE